MKITKTTTRTYEIYNCAKWNMSVGDTIYHRERVGMKSKGFDKCFICGKQFLASDYPYLAIVRNHANVFICEDCAKKIQAEREMKK